ncbi:MAG: TonB-dependent receptor, partial [Parvularculaceae bacterium]|nr:TonB-dependent receptor [Parvularculaceae bacterium]
QGATPVVGDAAVVPLSSPTIPQALRDATNAAFGGAAQALIIDKRFVELGPRRQQVDRSYLDFAIGMEADVSQDTHYSLTYRYANNRVVSIENDRIDRNKLTAALDPALCQTSPGCVPGDIFAYGGLAPDVLDYIKIDEIKRRLTVQEHEISARASHDMKFDNGASGSLAAGLDLKRTVFADLDLTPDNVAPIGQFNVNSNKAHLDVMDAFTEVDMPVLHRSAVGDVDATLAARATISPTFDPAVNFEAGVNWRPAPGVMAFTRQHIGRRTPTIADLFLIGTSVEAFYTDPCDSPTSPVVIDNCASAGPLGVPAGFMQTDLVASQTTYGNPQAKSEKIRSSAYGLTLTPTDMFTDLPGRLQITGTWLDYLIDNAISTSKNPLVACYGSISLSDPACGLNPTTGAPVIVRDPVSHRVISTDAIIDNTGYMRWQGLDLELRYAYEPLDLGPIDRLWVNVLHTYTYRVVTGFSDGARTRIDGRARDPHHRTLFTLGAEGGRLGLALFGNRRGRALTSDVDIPEAHISPAFYLDASARLNFDANTYVQFGVQNLTNTEPEITAYNRVGNFAPEYYDPVGRRFSLTFRTEF